MVNLVLIWILWWILIIFNLSLAIHESIGFTRTAPAYIQSYSRSRPLCRRTSSLAPNTYMWVFYLSLKNIYIYMYVCGYGSWRTNVLYWTFRFMALPWPTFMVRQGQPSISSFDDLPPIYIWLLGTEVLPLPPTIHTYRHIRIRIYIYLFIYVYIYIHVCIHVYVHTYGP